MSTPTKVGTSSAYFRLTSGNLERLTPPESGTERADLVAQKTLLDHPWPAGAQVEVRLPVYEEDGWLFVANVTVATIPEDVETPYGTVRAPRVDRLPLSTDIWRSIPLGTLTAEAVEAVRADEFTARVLDEATRRRLDDGRDTTELRRPGRRPGITDDQLALAVEAYKANPRKGVVAAQEALQKAEVRGIGHNGEVTREQAKKAIERARRRGWLPPGRKTR